MRRGKGDCGKDEFFFLEFFFGYGLSRRERGGGRKLSKKFFPEFFFLEFFLPMDYREGRGVRKLSKIFFLKFFLGEGFLK